MTPLYILKIGGSVATYKNRPGIALRHVLLPQIARAIKESQKKKKLGLILIHGAGGVGHRLAMKYGLQKGTRNNKNKWQGALISRLTNQKLNTAITEIFIAENLRVTPVHTASTIIQKNKKIIDCDIKIIKESLEQKCIPLLYGEMVFDKTLGMSICSGDALASYLAQSLKADKIFFASDINGLYTQDPYINKNAKLMEQLSLSEIHKNIQLSKSHNIDVTGGLSGKIENLISLSGSSLESIEIFNGFNPSNYQKALLGQKFPHTIITV